MLPISVCIIAKNESKNIKTCLEALTPYNFEIVVVDTGSTDNTVALARRYTNRVYSFEWCNDFSAARNYSIQKATNDWILILDCDEILSHFDKDALTNMMENAETTLGQIICMNEVADSSGHLSFINVPVNRIFNRNYYHFTCSIHEQATPIDPALAIVLTPIPIIFVHTGYNLSFEESNEKQTRNVILLEEALLKNPNNPYLHSQLGQSAQILKDIPKAIKEFETALSLSPPPSATYTKLLYINYASLLKSQGDFEKALELLTSAGDILKDYSDASYLSGSIYYKLGNYPAAIIRLLEALYCSTYYDMSTKKHLPHYLLGIIYEKLGDKDLACSFYKNCLDYRDAAKRRENLSSI